MKIELNEGSLSGNGQTEQKVSLQSGEQGDFFEVPFGTFILDAEYARDGQDLILSDSFGREVVIDGYFTFDTLPALTNEMGATVAGAFVSKLAGPGQVAQSGAASAALGEVVGTIETIEGSATVRHTDGTSEPLLAGTEIYKDDIIETGADSTLGVLMKDGSVMGVGPGSRLTIDNFVFDSGSNDGNLGLSFLKGAASFVSGKIAKNDYDDVDIKVPYGSIGIRGTEFVVDIAPDGTATVSVIEGLVATIFGDQEIVLEPGQLISLGAAGLSAVEQIAIAAIQARYGRILEAQQNTIIIRDGREATDDEGINVAPEAGGNPLNLQGDGVDGGPAEGGGNAPVIDDTIDTTEEEEEALLEFDPNFDIEVIDGANIGTGDGVGGQSGGNSGINADTTTLGPGDDDTNAAPNFDFTGGDGDDVFVGGFTNDDIFGGGGNDTLSGESGDDTVDGGTGNDFLQGGEGSVDVVIGGAGDDVLYGDNADDPDPTTGDHDTLFGGAGNDSLFGGGGNDLLDGGEDDDLLSGGFGDDTLDGDSGFDIADYDGFSENFSITANSGGYTVVDNATGDVDTLTDIEQVSFNDGTYSLVTFSLTGDTSVNEGESAEYTVSLAGTSLEAGQIATVNIAFVDGDTDGDTTSFFTAIQTAADNTAGVSIFTTDEGITLSFVGGPGNASELNFSLPVFAESTIEGNENYQIMLSNPSGSGDNGTGVMAYIDDDTVETTIVDGSGEDIFWTLSADAESVSEGGIVDFTIDFTGVSVGAGQTVSIDVGQSAGSATSPDFVNSLSQDLQDAAASATGVSVSGTTVTFDSSASQIFNFSVPTVLDVLVEGQEDFTLEISNPEVNNQSLGAVSGSGTVTVDIVDATSFDLSGTTTVAEGDSAIYTVSLGGIPLASGETASVDISLSDFETDSSDYADFLFSVGLAATSTSGVTLQGNTLNFIGGQGNATELNFTLPINGDTLIEGAGGNERFQVELSNPSGSGDTPALLNDAVETTIIDTSGDSLVWNIGSSSEAASEGSSAVFTIDYTGVTLDAGQTVSIDVSFLVDSADAQDFTNSLAQDLENAVVSGVSVDGTTVTFDVPGVQSFSFAVPILADGLAEGQESYSLVISNPQINEAGGGAISGAGTETVSINDSVSDFIEFNLSGDATGDEGTSADFTVSYNGTLGANDTASVEISLSDIETDNSDYGDFLLAVSNAVDNTNGVSLSGNVLTFTNSATSLTFSLDLVADGLTEGPEAFEVELSNASSATGATVSIESSNVETGINDIDDITFSITGFDTINEGVPTEFVISYSGNLSPGQQVSVDINLTDIDTETGDYGDFLAAVQLSVNGATGISLSGNTLTFTGGGSNDTILPVQLNISVEDGIEGPESFSIDLSNPVGTAVSIDPGQASLVTEIIDDDQMEFSIFGDTTVAENSAASYTITANGFLLPGETASIDVNVIDVDTTPADYESLLTALSDAAGLTSGVTVSGNTVTFDDSASSLTFDLTAFGADLIEGDEVFSVAIDNASVSNGGEALTIGAAQVNTTISDTGALDLFFTTTSQTRDEAQTAEYAIALTGLDFALATLPVGSSVAFDLDLAFVSADAGDISGNLSDALSGLPSGVTSSGVGNSVTITIDDTAAFTAGELFIDFDILLVTGDGVETDETFNLTISNVVNVGVNVEEFSTVHTTTIQDVSSGSTTGTPGNDVITGTVAGDLIDALAGNDEVNAGAGDDTVMGGDGIDTVRGGDGNDSIMGGNDNDFLFGQADSDTIFGGEGADSINGGSGSDIVDGGDGNDTVEGGDDNDLLFGGGGVNILEGGSGDDIYFLLEGDGVHSIRDTSGFDSVFVSNIDDFYRTGANDLTLEHDDGGTAVIDDYFGSSSISFIEIALQSDIYTFAAQKTLTGGILGDFIIGSEGPSDVLTGNAGNDLLLGQSGNDTLLGGDGDDFLIGEEGNDFLNGGDGFDTAYTEWDTTGVTVLLDSLSTISGDISNGTDTLLNVERVSGTEFNDTFTATTNFSATFGDFNAFEGGDGDDTITGNGNTRIEYREADGGVDVNLLLGSANTLAGINGATNVGNDLIFGGVNQVVGSTFDDSLTGGADDFFESFRGLDGYDTIDGGTGYDRADYLTDAGPIFAALTAGGTGNVLTIASDEIDTLISIEAIRGSDFNDSFDASAFTGGSFGIFNAFEGGNGDDTVTGNGETRVQYYGANGGVHVDLGLGFAMGTGVGGATNVGVDTFLGGVTEVDGSDFDDILVGGGSAEFELFRGRGGNDTIDGVSGFDRISYKFADAGISAVFSDVTDEAGTITNDGYGGTDTFTNIDEIEGSSFRDTLTGNSQDDRFIGGAGDDDIDGGAGYDVARFDRSEQTQNVSIVLAGNSVNNDGFGGVDLIFNIEEIRTGSGDDTVLGSFADERFIGNEGNDSLSGNTGNDTLEGGDGIDTLRGGGDDDFIVGGRGSDVIEGGAGNDISDYRDLSSAITVIMSGGGAGTVASNGDTDTLTTIEEVIGSDFNDSFTGSADADRFRGEDGNDTLLGNGGDDTLLGGLGSDILNGGTGYDVVYNFDAASALTVTMTGTGSGTIIEGSDTNTLIGIEQVDGSAFDDIFTGDTDANVFYGFDGNDTLIGNDGDDFLQGGGGDDSLTGGNGVDTFQYFNLSDGVQVAGNGTFSGTSDVISDFMTDTDSLQLAGSAFSFNGGYNDFDDFLLTTGGFAYDGTNADYSGGQNTGEAKLIFDGSYLYYDANESAAGYTVVAEFSGGDVFDYDVTVT